MQQVNIFWFRRDLRLEDNCGLYHALKSGLPVVPIFIFDIEILKHLDNDDKRVPFIHLQIEKINKALKRSGSGVQVFHTDPVTAFKHLLNQYEIKAVYTNDDYEPYAAERDGKIMKLLRSAFISFHRYKDHVIFEKEEILKDNGDPYTVFTPYSRKWKAALSPEDFKHCPSEEKVNTFLKWQTEPLLSLREMGFEEYKKFPDDEINKNQLKDYAAQRNFPAIDGTSRLGIHLRFGTISLRQLAAVALENSETFLNELIWREFYQMILWHFPYVTERSFKPAYDNIPWRNNEQEFERWCTGETGYPIVDAGMRQLNETGFMHNRVRMITASFLCKHLLIDWRLGEAYFANKLLDFELASNNGGWQWCSGSGCDSAPYFRIFNPYIQTKKFDPGLHYVRKWVPEFEDFSYPEPIVEHDFARKRCLEVYSKALNEQKV